ncbi:MAG: polyprenyl synthetase family protein [Clostridia bacterium]|nr:polyprenyl synthetase family protein [Clostridia bacterium]
MKMLSPFIEGVDIPSTVIDLSRHFPELSMVDAKLEAEFNKHSGPVQEISHRLLNAGGKRIRPLLACISGRLFQVDPEDVITCASAIELIHMASLVHDDIIDNSDTRRGMPSVNAAWGNHAAVLTGDFLFAKAFELLSAPHLQPVLKQVVEAISSMCEGEIEQSLAKGDINQSETQYLERINKKTGKLIAVSCSVGALLIGTEPVKRLSLEDYGKCLGYGFQIIDDVLDFTGDSQSLGKPIGLDLTQGYVTLPVIKLLEHPAYSDRIKILLHKLPPTAAEMEEIVAALNESGALEQAKQQAKIFIEMAKEQLRVFEPSVAVTALSLLADNVLDRID